MPPPGPGRQEETLVYRVELDESSVAQIVRTARESVGIGLQQAGQVGGDLVTQGQLTTSTAMAQVGSHLEFMKRTFSSLSAPPGSAASASGMGVSQALGVRAGMVSPRFSEMESSLQYRASSVLGDAYSTGGLQAAKTGAEIGMGAASIALMFSGPPGWIAGGAIAAGEIGLDAGVSSSFDRAMGRRQMGGHMRQFGVRRSMAIARQFERDTATMAGSFDELSDVAKATLSNVRFRPGDDVNTALVSAIGDWRVAGKTLGLEKEDALAATGELYRMGMAPGSVSGFLGRVGSASQMMGYNPTAVNANAVQFARSAATQGYNALEAGNQFMIQAGTVSQMVRSGVLGRDVLTAAAGFAGPESEQVMATSRNLLAQTMALQGSGFGRAMTAGFLGGGRGGADSMLGAAMGMTTQDALSFEANRMTMDATAATQSAVAGMARQVITGAGGEVTDASLTSTIMRLGGYDFGAAQVLAQMDMNPGRMGVSNMAAQRMQVAAQIEAGGRSSILGEIGSDIAATGADVIGALHTGMSTRRLLATADPLSLATGGRISSSPIDYAMRGLEGQRGRAYRGVRGLGRYISDTMDNSFGEFGRDVGESINELGRDVAGMLGYERESSGRGRALGTFMSRREIEGMSAGELTSSFEGTSAARADYRRMFPNDPPSLRGARFTEFMRNRQQQVMKDVLDAGPTRRLQLSGDADLIRDQLGINVSEDDVSGLLMQTERARRQMENATTLEGRERVMSDFRGTLESIDFMRGTNSTQAAELLLNQTETRFTRAESNRLMGAMGEEAKANLLEKALGTKEARGQVARRFFKEGSEFISQLEGAGSDPSRFRRIITRAEAAGDLKRGAAKEIRRITEEGGGVAAAIQKLTMMDAADSIEIERNTKAETEGGDSPSGAPESGDLGDLVTTLGKTNQLLVNLVEKLES